MPPGDIPSEWEDRSLPPEITDASMDQSPRPRWEPPRCPDPPALHELSHPRGRNLSRVCEANTRHPNREPRPESHSQLWPHRRNPNLARRRPVPLRRPANRARGPVVPSSRSSSRERQACAASRRCAAIALLRSDAQCGQSPSSEKESSDRPGLSNARTFPGWPAPTALPRESCSACGSVPKSDRCPRGPRDPCRLPESGRLCAGPDETLWTHPSRQRPE